MSGTGKRETCYGSVIQTSCSNREKFTELVKCIQVPKKSSTVCFIDDYRLLGTLNNSLMLWDTSRGPHKPATFEVARPFDTATVFRSFGSIPELPFHEDPSKGIVGIAIRERDDIAWYLLVVPVIVLITLSERVSWDEWREHVTELRFHNDGGFGVLHSQVVYLSGEEEDGTPILDIHEFACRFEKEVKRSEARSGKDRLTPVPYDPSKPSYRIRLRGINASEYDRGSLLFTEGGVYAEPVS